MDKIAKIYNIYRYKPFFKALIGIIKIKKIIYYFFFYKLLNLINI